MEGRPLHSIDGLSYPPQGAPIVHDRERAIPENMDRLPSVVDVYKRALRVEDNFIDYLLRPYVLLAAILNRSATRQPQLEVERCTYGAGGATQYFRDFPGL